MLCECGGYFKGSERPDGNVFMRCGKCGQEEMICGPCDAWMEKVNGIFVCKCGNKETNCKAPVFSTNGVYDMDCGECPGDVQGPRLKPASPTRPESTTSGGS